MAIVKLTKKGYGQIELNQVAWRRDGRIEAQCRLDNEQFPADATEIGSVAENGMLFAIDNVTRTLKKATLELAASEMIGINYSTEHLYDERKQGYKDFFLTGGENFLPRLGYLAAGDKFTLNAACYDNGAFADEDAIKAALEAGTPVFAGIASDESGYWEISKEAPAAGPVARVIAYTDMPDGQPAVKLEVIKA
jgi:hypothetical protein